MPRPQKLYLARNRKPPGRNYSGLVTLLCLVLVGGGLWYFSRPARSGKSRAATPVSTTAPAPAPSKPQPQALPRSGPAAADQAMNSNMPGSNPIPPPTLPAGTANGFPRPPHDMLEVQIALDRQGISAGSLDGVPGSQTRAALQAFQEQEQLPSTGELNPETRTRLTLDRPPLTDYVVTSNDLARLAPLSKTWQGKAEQPALDYETILELVAEQGHAHPNLIRRLNPGVDWTNVVVGTSLVMPEVTRSRPDTKAAFVIIRLAAKTLEAFDAETNLLAHFPCSIAARVEKRPAGELHVAVLAPHPNYTFDPEIFPEVPEAQEIHNRLVLQPGPNNPVGTVWIGLDKPGYGIHGTPAPEAVGRTESHGCFRLANWNAEFLLPLTWVGMPVYVAP